MLQIKILAIESKNQKKKITNLWFNQIWICWYFIKCWNFFFNSNKFRVPHNICSQNKIISREKRVNYKHEAFFAHSSGSTFNWSKNNMRLTCRQMWKIIRNPLNAAQKIAARWSLWSFGPEFPMVWWNSCSRIFFLIFHPFPQFVQICSMLVSCFFLFRCVVFCSLWMNVV